MKNTIDKSDWVVIRLLRVIAKQNKKDECEDYRRAIVYLDDKYAAQAIVDAIVQLQKEVA
jgi:hypothetical protein